MTRTEERISRSQSGVQCIRTIREPMRLPTIIISPPCLTESDARAYCDETEGRISALRAIRAIAEAEHRSELQQTGIAA